MQIADVPSLTNEINDVRQRTAAIVEKEIIPNEPILGRAWAEGGRLPEAASLIKSLQTRTKAEGLWAPHLPKEYGGMGIGFLNQAYMHEIFGWSPFAGQVFGLAAPNSGNQVLLLKHGTPEQKKRWLEPLIRGEIESGFSMTEPDSPGSNPRAIQTRAVRDGDDWVINGRKWFTSNARRAQFVIVVCRTEEETSGAGDRDHLTQIIVPTDTPGFNIVRTVSVFGHDSEAEIVYDNVRVPITNQLGSVGGGHDAAQDRLGAGRIFHCMSSIGQMWRAFDLMARRAMTREVHGGMLETKQFIQGFLADSYIDITAARLMTIQTAEKIDKGLDVRTEISAIKVAVPAAMERVVDRAIQVHGAKGVSGDTPLEGMYRFARMLRIGDGPDEVHRILIAKNVMREYHRGLSWDFST